MLTNHMDLKFRWQHLSAEQEAKAETWLLEHNPDDLPGVIVFKIMILLIILVQCLKILSYKNSKIKNGGRLWRKK